MSNEYKKNTITLDTFNTGNVTLSPLTSNNFTVGGYSSGCVNWTPYTWYQREDDHMSKAFKIAKALREKKLVNAESVDKFIALVEEIATIT